MKSLFSWMLLGTGLRAMGVHREQRESRVQGMRQAPFMIDELFCITSRRRIVCKGSAIFCTGALDSSGPTPLMMTPHSHFFMAPQEYLCYYLRVVLSEI